MLSLLTKRPFSSACTTADVSQPTLQVKPDVDSELLHPNPHYEVAKDSTGKYLSCYLMNSNCSDNHNKYYIIQVLRNTKTNQISYHYRFGRVGNSAGNMTSVVNNLDQATKMYFKTYKQKTSAGKGYTPIDMKLGKSDAFVKSEVVKIGET